MDGRLVGEGGRVKSLVASRYVSFSKLSGKGCKPYRRECEGGWMGRRRAVPSTLAKLKSKVVLRLCCYAGTGPVKSIQ